MENYVLSSEVAQGFRDIVGFYLLPYPLQQFPFRRTFANHVDLVPQNESPDQTQNELQLSINNIWLL